MSKKTHQKQLERARAKRQASTHEKQVRSRWVGIAVVAALGLGVFGIALANRGDDNPVIDGLDQFDDTVADATTDDSLTPPDTTVDDPNVRTAEQCPLPEDAPTSPLLSYPAAPEMTIDPAATYVATIETTCGSIVVELNAAEAPNTVNNFVFLANEGYYVGSPFHRVIDGFMIQGGDPSGTGHGDGGTYPGYRFEDELGLAEAVYADNNGYPRGTIAMANSGPNSNGSQFFIMHSPEAPYPLPPQYVVFGQAIEGLDVVDRIALGPVAGDQAIDPVIIIGITIEVVEA